MLRAVGLFRSMPCWMAWAVLALNVPAAAAAHSVGATEYEVKAAFLFNFSQFVSWPASSFASPNAPIVIGVLGDDPFGGALDEVVRGERVKGRALEVRRYAEVQDVGTCHILFIPHERAPPLDEILERLSGRNILTVGDSRDFAERGGVIGLVTVQHRVRLRVNLDAARAADLTISSKLLRPAEIVASQAGR